MPPVQPASLFSLGDELAPGFDLFIEGKDASAANPLFEAIRPLIAGVSYEEDEEMAGLFELHVACRPDDTLGVKADWKAVLDCKAFQEGNAVDLFMGYAGEKTYMGRVEIVKWLPRGSAQGYGELVIKGFDGRHRMMLGNQFKAKTAKDPKSGGGKSGKAVSLEGKAPKGTKGTAQKQRHSFKGMTDDVIVGKIAAKYGFAADCDSPDKGLGAKVGGQGKGGRVFAGGRVYDLTTAKGRLDYAVYQQGLRKLQAGQKVKTQAELRAAALASKRRSASFPSRVQTAEQTDWQFLQKLAAINRFDLWVDYDQDGSQWVVHFKRRQDVGNPIYSFSYNGNDGSLIEWEADFSVKEQSTTAEVLFFDRKTQKIQLTQVQDQTRDEVVSFGTAAPGSYTAKQSIGVGARVRFTAFGQTLEAVRDKPFRSQKDAEEFVKDWMKERERDLIILKGKVVGMEDLRPRQVHEFLGMSARLDGLYRFTQVRHAMFAGAPYVVEFLASKVLSEDISRKKPTTKAKTKVQGTKVFADGQPPK